MKIQISDDVKRALDKTGLFLTAPRGVVDVKVSYFYYHHHRLISQDTHFPCFLYTTFTRSSVHLVRGLPTLCLTKLFDSICHLSYEQCTPIHWLGVLFCLHYSFLINFVAESKTVKCISPELRQASLLRGFSIGRHCSFWSAEVAVVWE